MADNLNFYSRDQVDLAERLIKEGRTADAVASFMGLTEPQVLFLAKSLALVVATPATGLRLVVSKPSCPQSIFDTCQWIDGEAAKRKFCGKSVHGYSSWCKKHFDICYAKEHRTKFVGALRRIP